MNIWDPENECLSPDALREIQLARLRHTLEHAYWRVPHYRGTFDAAGVHPEKVKTLEDLAYFPFLRKADLRRNFPYGMLAVPMRDVVRIHSSSGTTGQATVVAYTRQDLENWSELVARIVTAGGVGAGDIAQIAFGYGLFTGAFGLHYGLEKVGASVIPVSTGNTERQVAIMRDFGTTTLICTPSYALHIAEVARESGVGREQLKLRFGLFGAEAWSESMRKQIESELGILATDNYGLSEVMGPGVSGECEHRCGLHLNEDHFLVEVIDPETEMPVLEGETGELVITSLTKEALPVVRYRTGDLASIVREPCLCGRTSARMSRVKGRTDDMLIVRGVNVFPSQIEDILLEVEGTTPQYQIVLDRKGALDEMEIRVEVTEEIMTDEEPRLRALESTIRKRLQAALQVSPIVRLVEPRSIERSMGKAQRVVDKRVI